MLPRIVWNCRWLETSFCQGSPFGPQSVHEDTADCDPIISASKGSELKMFIQRLSIRNSLGADKLNGRSFLTPDMSQRHTRQKTAARLHLFRLQPKRRAEAA